MTKKTKFHFSRAFAIKIIKTYSLADFQSQDDVDQVVSELRAAGPVPRSFWAEGALKVASGSVKYVWDAFVWDETPQGHVYWQQLADGKRELSRKDRAILLYWLALDAGEKVDHEEPAS